VGACVILPGNVDDLAVLPGRTADESMQQHIDASLCAQPVEHELNCLRLEDHEHTAMAAADS
jgi:hypothetical protein